MNTKFEYGYSKSVLKLENSFDSLYFMGKKYQSSNEIFVEAFNIELDFQLKNLIWMTYRKGFPSLLPDVVKYPIQSDSGWGCMLRVG